MRRTDDIVIDVLLGFCGGDSLIPEGSGINSDHIAFELGHVSRSRHGFAEIHMGITVDTQHADHEWHLRGRKIFAYISNELGQQV